MNFGSKFLAGHRPGHSAYLVRRLQDAGFVIVGITNMPEFGILPTTEPRHGGPTRNPWDTGRTPGGSSGGAAAAVAGGMLPVAHGNDGGGSLRIPAACCGLVGLKPSRGRVSRGPDLGDSFLACDGVLTRTVAETAQLLDVLAGYEVGDATWAPRPAEPYTLSARRDPGRLRIAMTAENALEADVDPECMRGMHETAELLAALGHEIEEASPALPGKDTLRLFTGASAPRSRSSSPTASCWPGGRRRTTRSSRCRARSPTSRKGMSSIEYLACVAQLQALARGVVAFFAEYDVLLTPALAERPLQIGECNGLGEDPMADFARSGQFTPFTALFNVTGQPAHLGPGRLRRRRPADQRPPRRQAAGRGHAAAGRLAARGRARSDAGAAVGRRAPRRAGAGGRRAPRRRRCPRGVRIVTPSSSASSQVAIAVGPASAS